ncbi:hypothetical protein ACJIZ3_008959 [Penstemon smallii]|uniref:DNAJ-containing protein X-domain domain-containing protein n=1 Tax=Penstemon smallii TaxID=265156 RepID=A0ABD3TCV9_9LAMI
MKSDESLRKTEGFDQEKYQHKMRNFQKEREEKLTGILKNRLNLYVQGNKEEFIRCAQAQVSRLSDVAYGVELLSIIGYVYANEAAQELGKKVTYLGVPFVAEWLRNVGHTWKSNFSFVKSEFSILLQLNGIRIRNGKGHYTEEELAEYLDSYEKAMTDGVWKEGVVDIEETLSRVCQTILQDNNAKKEELCLRAEGLKILGNIFQEVLCEWKCSTTSWGVAGCTKNLKKSD